MERVDWKEVWRYRGEGALVERLFSDEEEPAYAAFQSLRYHSWGLVLEKNWTNRAKLALESNFICNKQGSNPWVKAVNVLAEMNYLLTYHLSLRAVGFYSHSMGPGNTSYQVRSVSGGLSCRF